MDCYLDIYMWIWIIIVCSYVSNDKKGSIKWVCIICLGILIIFVLLFNISIKINFCFNVF